ncbi:MAG TPA: single-stranded DNA-binding protein [Candidatus Paceibacterota bacterium]|nr:single-stranded DNA-binding protein [Candidatus Paceibacterota bacterium]
MDLNKVILVGRVTADPQLRTTPGGQSVTTIGVATNRTWTDKNGAKQEQPEFHNIVMWGRTAEIAGQYLTKGAMVLIEGRIQTRSWTDKQGQQRKTTEIMCERLQLGPRAAGGGGGQGGGKSFGTPSSSAQGGDKDAIPSLDEIPVINLEEDEIKPEDIPF